MNLALNQARKTLGKTKDNPAVGCVIVKNDKLISAGFTSLNGRPHAEQNAINLSTEKVKNSNLYVTLEPCSNYGFTPPCVNLIIKKKIKKVFFSINDNDSRSYKKAKSKLKENNILVTKGILSKKVNTFYRSYNKFKKKTLPFVTSKLAISKDFFTVDKKEKWITNEHSRARVHLIRSNHDCIITSSQTINADNPRLTCRIEGLKNKSPARIILDNKLKIKVNSKIIKESNKHKTIIFYNKTNIKKISFLNKKKVKTYKVPLNDKKDIDLRFALEKVKKLGFSRILLESGIKLNKCFLDNNLVDDFIIFSSNKKLGNRGEKNIQKYLRVFMNYKKKCIEKVNLFGEQFTSYTIK